MKVAHLALSTAALLGPFVPGLRAPAVQAPGVQAPAPVALPSIVFTNARVIDGTDNPPAANVDIVVNQGRIEAIGPGAAARARADAPRVDLAGKTVIPGLVNAHGHVSNPDRDLKIYAAYGVTTVFSLGGESQQVFAARDRQTSAPLSRARVFVAGPVLAPNTVEEARTAIAQNAASGANLVKIRVDDTLGTTTKMPPDVYKAVIDEAHKRGQRVAVHLFYLADAKAVLDAGADFIAHSVRDLPVDADLVAKLKARNICLCPTLMREVATFGYETTPDFLSDPLLLKYADPQQIATLKQPARQEQLRNNPTTPRYKQALEIGSRNLKTLTDAGVTIAMGTDTGSLGRFQGYFELMELEMMVKAGLTPKQALQAATRNAARCHKLDADLGTLERGKWADLVVLDADPLADIKNVRRIADVYVGGSKVER